MSVLKATVLFILFSLLPFQLAYGKIVAVVSKIEGNGFYTYEGKTFPLKEGAHLPIQAEIFTDMGAQLSLNDYYDHVYHLAGGGHMIVHANLIELKEGYLWVQSLGFDPLRGPLRVMTANAVVENTLGESIVSFDVYTGKTQLLAIKGSFALKNALMERMELTLSEGQFSFIQNEHEEGRPRKPTPIGYSSYKKVTGLFNGVQPFDKDGAKNFKTRLTTAPREEDQIQTPNRGVASATPPVKTDAVFEAALASKKNREYPGAGTRERGKVTLLRLNDPEVKSAHQESVLSYYENKVKEMAKPAPKKKWRPKYNGANSVAVKVYGAKNQGNRVPASVKKQRPAVIKVTPGQKEVKTKKVGRRTPASIGGMLPKIKTNAFESEIFNQYKKQMRHKTEVNDLIDQLQSIDMDYKKDY